MKVPVLAAIAALLPTTMVLGQSARLPTAQPVTHAASVAAQAQVQSDLEGWPKATQALAARLIAKYGQPNASSVRELTWYDNGPWTRTVLYRKEIQHNFPSPHKDVLEQTVNYRVPVEKIGDLAAYDGSIVVDRTRGELSVHCDSEAANILTFNIADDIVKGERTVEQALTYHAQVVRGVQIDEPESYPQKLRFPTPRSSSKSADAGEEAPLLQHLDN